MSQTLPSPARSAARAQPATWRGTSAPRNATPRLSVKLEPIALAQRSLGPDDLVAHRDAADLQSHRSLLRRSARASGRGVSEMVRGTLLRDAAACQGRQRGCCCSSLPKTILARPMGPQVPLLGLECLRCGALHDDQRLFEGCPACRECGVSVNLSVKLDYAALRALTPEDIPRSPRSLWRFRALLPPLSAEPVTLG